MDILLLAGGGLMALVGWIWIMITAFSESVLWGVGILLLGPLGLVYGFLRWDELKVPTILYAAGIVIYVIGRVI